MNDLMKQYDEYVKERESFATRTMTNWVPRNLAAGIDFEDVKINNYQFLKGKKAFFDGTYELVRNKGNDKTILLYGTEEHNGKPHNNGLYILASNKKMIDVSTTETEIGNKSKGNIYIHGSEICPEGLYEMSIEFNFAGYHLHNFRFYPNNFFESASKANNLTVDELKRKLFEDVAYKEYNYKLVTEWGEEVGKLGNHNAETIKNYVTKDIVSRVNIKKEELFMLANKLYREGLEKIFKLNKLEITEEDRRFYM